MGKKVLFAAVFILTVCAGAFIHLNFDGRRNSSGTASPPSAEAAALPKIRDFQLSSLDGRKVKLSSEVKRNKVTILNFFATWCPPCRAETPGFVKFYKSYRNKGVEIIAVDLREDSNTVKEFVAKYGIPYTVLMDKAGKVSDMYEVYSIPSTLVINGKGQVVTSFLGMIQEDSLEKAVKAILE